jgi:hypothetical protein
LLNLLAITRNNEKDQRRWKILFALEELLGRNRRMVYAAIALKVRHKVTRFYHPPPYRPKSIINSVEGWFNDSIPPQIGEGGWVKEIVPEQSVYSKKLDHINDEIQPAFSKYGKSHAFPKAYLCCLKNAKMVIDTGEVIPFDDKVFDDFTFECGKSIEGGEVFKSIDVPQFRREVLATITSIAGAKNYYHWIFDDLPRLKLLEGVIDEIDYLIVPHDLKRFHLETLDLLGFPEGRLLKIKDGMHLQCEKLFIPSFGATWNMPWTCEFLRDSFLPDDLAEPHRLIYISRKDAPYRKIINEEEVEDYLREIGFEIVQMSELPFLEQVKICAEAKIVVGPHGAGLSNIIFCRDAKVLEIFSPSYVNECYWSLINIEGAEYYYLIGENTPENLPFSQRNFKVDMGRFKRALEKMMGAFK